MKKLICAITILFISFSLNCPHGKEKNITLLPSSKLAIKCKTINDCLKGPMSNCIIGFCIAEECFYGYLTDGTPCDDKNPCTINKECLKGLCMRGKYIECPPLDQCHEEGYCNSLTGKCIYDKRLNGTHYNDKNSKTLIDYCHNGKCVGASNKEINECHKKILSTK